MNVSELVETIEKGARENFAEHGQVSPVFFAVDRDERISIIMTGWRNVEEKHMVYSALSEMFRKDGVVMYGFASETWMRSFEKTESRGRREIASYEDKREGVLIGAVSRAGESITKTMEIERPMDGSPPRLLEAEDISGTGGGMMRLLDD